MWIAVVREPRPDAPHWPGRRALAVIDALAWPALWLIAVALVPFRTGVFGAVVVAVALFAALARLHRATMGNERYQFTTWRWGVPMIVLTAMGMLTGIVR